MTDLTLLHPEPAPPASTADGPSFDETTSATADRGLHGGFGGSRGRTAAELEGAGDAEAIAVFDRTLAHMRAALTGVPQSEPDGRDEPAMNDADEDEADDELDRDATDVVLDHAFGTTSSFGGPRTRLSLDKIVVAALVADATARHPDLLRIIADGSGVVMLDAPKGIVFDDVRSVLEALAEMSGTPCSIAARIDPDRNEVADDDRCLVVMNTARNASFCEPSEAASALRYAGFGVIAVREVGRDAKGNLADLIEIADHRIDLRLRPSLIKAILRITIRDAADRIDAVSDRIEKVADDVTIADLKTVIAPRRDLKVVVSDLEARIAKRRRHGDGDTPTLEELPGYGSVKAFGLAVAKDLRAYRDGGLPWTQIDPGFVLNGPPGAGKTLFVQALAKSADVPLVIGSLAAWQADRGGHLGDMLRAMRQTFQEARRHKACVLLIDELDSVGDRATFDERHRSYSVQVLNALLELLDGTEPRDGVLVIGATNYASRIDDALLRPGRLDRVIEVGLPDRHELAAILRFHLRGDLAGADLMPAALLLRGGSGADAAGAVRRARATARRANRPLGLSDLFDAAAQGRSLPTGEARYRIAVHEAGHAVIGHALDLGSPGALSIHANGGSAEMTMEDWPIITPQRAQAYMIYCLAGRAAEQRILGSVCAGAGGSAESDLARATMIAARAVGSWGLGDGPPLWIGAIETDRALETAVARLHGSIRPMLAKAETEAAELVERHEETILAIAARLETAGYLEGGEVEPFIRGVELS